MTDPFDVQLRERLGALADAVPVEPSRSVGRVARPAVRPGSTGRRWSLVEPVPIVAFVVVGALLTGALAIGLGARGDGSEPVVSVVRDGDFELTLTSEKGLYARGEEIHIRASLAYNGPRDSVEITHAAGARGAPVAFGVQEPVIGDFVLGGGWDMSCNRSTLTRGTPLEVRFQKGGAGDSADPREPEFIAYLQDPKLTLPPGRWHPYVVARFQEGRCGEGTPIEHELRAQIEIIVTDADPTASPDTLATPSPDPTRPPATPDPNQPVVDTAVDGPYSIELRSPKRTFVESERIDIVAIFRYEGQAPITITHGANGWIGFGIREPVYDLQLGPSWLTSCGPTELPPGFEKAQPFTKSGGVSANDPDHDLKMEFLQDPELRLPAGVWHIVAVAAFAEAPACGGMRPALTTEIEIEVVPAPVVTEPPPSYPAVSPGPLTTADGLESIESDGTFEVRLASPKARWFAGEIIDIEAQVTYRGPEDEVVIGASSSFLGFTVTQLDGVHAAGSGGADVCTHTTFWRDVPHTVRFRKGGGYSPDDPDFHWRQAYTDTSTFRLTPGAWRIEAALEAAIPSCDGDRHRVESAIVIEVEAPVIVGTPGFPTTDPQWGVQRIQEYGSLHPDTFGAVWINHPLLGPSEIATSWTGDFERHRAWLEQNIGYAMPVAMFEADFTAAELDRVETQIRGDLEWLESVPADVIGLGTTGSGNRVSLEVSSAVPDASSLIREHYAATFGFDPRILTVTSDGTGAAFVPWGMVRVRLDLPPGGVPEGVELVPGWRSDVTGLRCGVGDVGVAFEEMPCQEGPWTILVMASRDGGDSQQVGEGFVEVVAGQSVELTIEVRRFP